MQVISQGMGSFFHISKIWFIFVSLHFLTGVTSQYEKKLEEGKELHKN